MLEEKAFDEADASIERGVALIASGMQDGSKPEILGIIKKIQDRHQEIRASLKEIRQICYHPDYEAIRDANKAKESLQQPANPYPSQSTQNP